MGKFQFIKKSFIVRFVFKLIYWRWYKDCKIISVLGWRTALMDCKKEYRKVSTACFTLLGKKFD